MNIKETEIQAPWGKICMKLWGNQEDPAILAVHGRLDNAGSFDGIIPLLPQHYFYICIDLPGHGKSDHFPSPLPIHSIDFIIVYKIVMEYFNRQKYIIMGHSYGGQLGYLFAQIYPEKVEKLVMLDSIHLVVIPSKYFKTYLEGRWSYYFEIEKKRQARNPPQYTYEEALHKMLTGRASPLTEKSAKALLKRMLVPKDNGKYELSIDQRLKHFINPIHDERYAIETMKEHPVRCPVLMVLGKDNGTHRSAMRPILNVLKKQPNVTMKYVPGHHDVHQNYPERVAPHVVTFLNLHKNKL